MVRREGLVEKKSHVGGRRKEEEGEKKGMEIGVKNKMCEREMSSGGRCVFFFFSRRGEKDGENNRGRGKECKC